VNPSFRHDPTPAERLLGEVQAALSTLFARPHAARPNPGEARPSPRLDARARRHVAGLMRVNHAGEVCAQALYLGQAAVARDPATREQLRAAAQEEADHLAWCAERLDELGSPPSRLNPLWYTGSYAIGVIAGLRGDGWNLGFVVETERQVEAHLEQHLARLPAEDERSRAILVAMKADEARHADEALAAGARRLPAPLPQAMGLAAGLMKALAYRI